MRSRYHAVGGINITFTCSSRSSRSTHVIVDFMLLLRLAAAEPVLKASNIQAAFLLNSLVALNPHVCPDHKHQSHHDYDDGHDDDAETLEAAGADEHFPPGPNKHGTPFPYLDYPQTAALVSHSTPPHHTPANHPHLSLPALIH